jgi:hypothetical protein
VGERRARKQKRLEVEQTAQLAGVLGVGDPSRRESQSHRAGEAVRSGDPAYTPALEGALRHRGRIERATHGFHTYPAGLNPDAARDLLALGTGPVLDPFCGGGTVLVEALLSRRGGLGLDVSPIAGIVARARTTVTTEAERTAFRVAARKAAELAQKAAQRGILPPDVPPALEPWYEPHVLAELASLRASIGKDPLLRAVFSAILVKVSKRESDTSSAKTKSERPPGTTATLFHKKARELGRQLEELAEAAGPDVRVRVHREDARDLRERAAFGMVVTSPPYPGVYDYLAMQHLRLTWLGLDADAANREEIGSRRQFRLDREVAVAAWRVDNRKWMKAAARALVPGGRMIVVIGDGQVGRKRVDSREALEETGRALGLARLARVTVERWDEGVEAMRPEHAILWERQEGTVEGESAE